MMTAVYSFLAKNFYCTKQLLVIILRNYVNAVYGQIFIYISFYIFLINQQKSILQSFDNKVYFVIK